MTAASKARIQHQLIGRCASGPSAGQTGREKASEGRRGEKPFDERYWKHCQVKEDRTEKSHEPAVAHAVAHSVASRPG